MNRMCKQYYIVTLFLSFSILIFGQEEINQDVRVVREYTPTVSDAFKINKLPELNDTVTYSSSFKYKILSKAMEAELEVQPITAAKLKNEKQTVLDKSYARAGFGNYWTGFGDLYYNILRSEDFAFGLKASHISSLGDVELENKKDVDAPYHNTDAGVYFRRFYKKASLGLDMDFQRRAFNYYGFQTVGADSVYCIGESNENFNGQEFEIDKSQRLSVFDLKLRLENNVEANKDNSYNVEFKYSTFGNKTNVTENNFALGGMYRIAMRTSYVEINANADHFSVSSPNLEIPAFDFVDRKMTVLSLKPRVGFVLESASLQVGLNLHSQLGDVKEDMFIGPHVQGDLIIAPSVVSVFGGLTSKLNINNYRKIAFENNFVSPDHHFENSFYGINAFGGVKGNFSKAISFIARFDYGVFNDEYFFVNKAYTRADDAGNPEKGNYDYSNLFGADIDDGSVLSVSGELVINPSPKAFVKLRGQYNSWKVDFIEAAWHKPEVELAVSAKYKLFNDVNLYADLYSIGKRPVKSLDPNWKEELDGVIDFNLKGEYEYSSQWLFFASINNMFANKYYQWNGYPSQSINVRVGAGYSF